MSEKKKPAPWWPRTLTDDDHIDRGRTEPRTDAQKDAAMPDGPHEGDSRLDRFKIIMPLKNPRSVATGLIFRNGIGYTGDPNTANVCRGLKFEVIDRQNHKGDDAPPAGMDKTEGSAA